MKETQGEALLVIDVQRDFLSGGSLAVPDGEAVIPIINQLGKRFSEIILTQDWHPAGHISFGSTHGKQPFIDTVEARYGTQSLWPDHTLQESHGAALHPDLYLPHAGLIVRKGFRKDVDSYSAFLENDHQTSPDWLATCAIAACHGSISAAWRGTTASAFRARRQRTRLRRDGDRRRGARHCAGRHCRHVGPLGHSRRAACEQLRPAVKTPSVGAPCLALKKWVHRVRESPRLKKQGVDPLIDIALATTISRDRYSLGSFTVFSGFLR